MLTALIIFGAALAWVGLGSIGIPLARYWWTSSFDWTTQEQALAWLFAVMGGPINILVGLFLAIPAWVEERSGGRILKERRR